MDHRFTRLGQILVIFTQPATPIEPPEGAFNDPPLGQDHEPFLRIRPPHDLQLDPAALEKKQKIVNQNLTESRENR